MLAYIAALNVSTVFSTNEIPQFPEVVTKKILSFVPGAYSRYCSERKDIFKLVEFVIKNRKSNNDKELVCISCTKDNIELLEIDFIKRKIKRIKPVLDAILLKHDIPLTRLFNIDTPATTLDINHIYYSILNNSPDIILNESSIPIIVRYSPNSSIESMDVFALNGRINRDFGTMPENKENCQSIFLLNKNFCNSFVPPEFLNKKQLKWEFWFNKMGFSGTDTRLNLIKEFTLPDVLGHLETLTNQ